MKLVANDAFSQNQRTMSTGRLQYLASRPQRRELLPQFWAMFGTRSIQPTLLGTFCSFYEKCHDLKTKAKFPTLILQPHPERVHVRSPGSLGPCLREGVQPKKHCQRSVQVRNCNFVSIIEVILIITIMIFT